MQETLTLKLGQVIQAEPALARLAKKELPLRLALHVARIYRAIAVEQQAFEGKRQELVRRLGEPVNGTGMRRVSHENLPAFAREVEDAAAIEVTLHCSPLLYADLQGLDNFALSAEDLLLLNPLLSGGPLEENK